MTDYTAIVQDAAHAALQKMWRGLLKRKSAYPISLMLALLGKGVRPLRGPELSRDDRQLLMEWLAERRLRRPAMLAEANRLLPEVCHALHREPPPPLKSPNFGIIVYRLRKQVHRQIERELRTHRGHQEGCPLEVLETFRLATGQQGNSATKRRGKDIT